MKQIRIGLVGKRHAGKSTFAAALLERGFTRIALADPLKDVWVDMYNLFLERIGQEPMFTRAQLETEKELHRLDLERLGTIHGRRLDDTCWIDLFRQRVTGQTTNDFERGRSSLIVCDDVRFLNEVEALRSLDFTIVKLVRDEYERTTSIRKSLGRLWDQRFGEFDPLHPLWLQRQLWVDKELERTQSLPSEIEVDCIDADVCIANTSIEMLLNQAKTLVEDGL